MAEEHRRVGEHGEVHKGANGWERRVGKNGKVSARITLPLPVLKAVGVLVGDIVVVDVVSGGGILQKEIRIRVPPALQDEPVPGAEF